MSEQTIHEALTTPEAMWQRQVAAAADLAFFINQRDPIGIGALLDELRFRHGLLFPAAAPDSERTEEGT